MNVILSADVKSLGKKGTLCKVSDGYARNYLFPRKLAIEASKHNIDIMQSKQNAGIAKEERAQGMADGMADRINNMILTLEAEAGESGKLFGAITNKDISKGLKDIFEIDIDKKKIGNITIKNIGEKDVIIKLYKGVNAKLKVRVTKRDQEDI
jgi:large subunit ribosomal protein L9